MLFAVTVFLGTAFRPPPHPKHWSSVHNTASVPNAAGLSNLSVALQEILDRKASQWNSSGISVAVAAAGGIVKVASGYADWARRDDATPDHMFPMGSVQKMYTASAVMLLVEKGIVRLNDTISQHVDPYIHPVNGSTLLSLFGPTVRKVTVQHLLSMRSGLGDFDDASTRAYQLARPSYDITPFDILHLCQKDFACIPGECGRYSSTGYVVLGLLLAKHAGVAWDAKLVPAYESDVLPSGSAGSTALSVEAGPASLFSSTYWAIHGELSSYATSRNPVAHGYQPDTGEWPWPFGGDVYNVSATAGWTCGNLIATASDCASFARDLYGSVPRIVSAASVAQMTQVASLGPGSWDYGMGTMALPGSRPGSAYYGHGGATYGFYSYVGYNVDKDFALAVVTNLELVPSRMYENLDDIHSEVYQVVEAAFSGPAQLTYMV